MDWIIPVGVVAAMAIAAIAYRRFIERRYEDIYSGEDPPYQDPPVLPSPPTSGGIG